MLRSTGNKGTAWTAPGKNPSEPAVPVKNDYACYRKLIFLKNDKRVMLRFLHNGDRQRLITLFQNAPDEDLRFFKHDLKNPELLHFWLDRLDYRRVLPLAAIDLAENRIIAAATLLKGKRGDEHIGEIKIFIAQDFRGLRLGSRMLDELILLAAQEKMCWLKAEVATSQKTIIKALRSKGFQIRATLEDYFIREDGVTLDMVLMMRPMTEAPEEY
jgi:ribosomal protein S18 acetylase RimI-like enzyme